MKRNLPNVLMLGWEFPPIINGGLGVACHDLSIAMSELANITMIVPKSSPDFKIRNMNLVGINNVDTSLFDEQSWKPKLPFNVESISADLDPYYSEIKSTFSRAGMEFSETRSGIDSFNITDLYGGDVIGKVCRYADIASKLASKMDFDVIHAHDWMTMIAGMRIKEQSGKPLVMHIHSLEVDRGGEDSRGWVYELEKIGMQTADLLIPVSNFTSLNIQKFYGISSHKIAVVHNGSTVVNAYKSERKVREKIVLFVGRLTRQKGPEKFLDIASKVLEKDPDVRFVMAGVGDYFRSLLEQSSYKSIGNRFHMTGFLNMQQLHYLFSMSDVYCMPSVSEPFGLSAVEAAQFGIPCVISKQSGVAEVMSGSMKFDFWDVDKAADCIINLLSDNVLRQKIVDDSAKDLRNISWDISARRIVDTYAQRKLIFN
ncbi:MAG: glycosyltransferase [Bacteroidia bacterium]